MINWLFGECALTYLGFSVALWSSATFNYFYIWCQTKVFSVCIYFLICPFPICGRNYNKLFSFVWNYFLSWNLSCRGNDICTPSQPRLLVSRDEMSDQAEEEQTERDGGDDDERPEILLICWLSIFLIIPQHFVKKKFSDSLWRLSLYSWENN